MVRLYFHWRAHFVFSQKTVFLRLDSGDCIFADAFHGYCIFIGRLDFVFPWKTVLWRAYFGGGIATQDCFLAYFHGRLYFGVFFHG